MLDNNLNHKGILANVLKDDKVWDIVQHQSSPSFECSLQALGWFSLFGSLSIAVGIAIRDSAAPRWTALMLCTWTVSETQVHKKCLNPEYWNWTVRLWVKVTFLTMLNLPHIPQWCLSMTDEASPIFDGGTKKKERAASGNSNLRNTGKRCTKST